MKLILEKGDLTWLQKNGYMGQEQVGIVWDQLAQKCNIVPEEGSNSSQVSNTKKELELPNVEGILLGEAKTNDICIAFSLKNGANLAKSLQERLTQKKKKVVLSSDDSFDALEAEKRIASATSLVVLLTEDCLKQAEIVFALTVAKFYYQHPSLVVLVHDAESCYFPSYDEQPESVRDFFSEKAITFLSCYPDEGVQEIIVKFDNEVHVLENILENFRQKPTDALYQFLAKNESRGQFPIQELRNRMKPFMTKEQLDEFEVMADKNKDGTLDPDELQDVLAEMKRNAESKDDEPVTEVEEPSVEDLTTRVFLSHKRSTGQGIAGRFYEGLKKSYKVFIDSEAKFKIHNLKLIVQNTDVLVFILTYGILLSKWCLEELKAAIANKKRVIVVRELSFKYPDELPEEWKEVEPVLKNSKELIWIAEYNSACVNALHNFIGSPDDRYRPAAKYFSTREGKSTLNAILQKFQTTKILDLNRHIPLPSSVEGVAALDFVLDSIPAQEIKVLHYTSGVEQAAEGSDKILPSVFARLPNVLELSLAGSGGLVSNQTVKEICSRYPLLVKLDLEQCIELTSEAAKYIKELEHLTELNLGKISSLRDDAVTHLAAGNPKLEVLKIGFAEVTHKSFENLSKITNLKELEFPFRLKKHEDAKKYLEGHPNVKVKMEPIVFDCKDFNGTWRPAVVKSFSATQTAVHYYGQQDYSDDLLNKTQFHEKTAEYKTHKEEYGAEDSSHASTDCPMCEALHADLEHVKFGGARNMHFINDWYFEEPDGIEFLKSFLENAEKGQILFNSYSLQPGLKFTTVLKALFKTHPCEKITEFYMDVYSNLDGLADALKALPHLKVFWNTLSATELTEIQPLADALPPIEELYWSAYLSDKCAEYLATKIPNVTTLYLWLTYSDMTEKGFSALLPEDNKIQNLTIRNYPKLTPEILQKIAQNCKNVVTLDLTLNEGLVQDVDDVVVHLIKGFPSLKKIILDSPITKSEKFAEFKNARPDVSVDDGCYTRDIQDVYRSCFYPAIQVSERKGPNPTLTYHEYGTGTEAQISLNVKEDEAKSKPFLSNVATYGPQDSYHSTNDCFYCSLLHPYCEKMQFSGLPNKFFQNDWFFDGEEGKSLVTKFVPQGPENRIVFNIPLPDGIREWAIVRALAKTAEPEKTFTVNFPSTIYDIGKLLAQPLNITAIELDRDFYYQPEIFKQISTKRPKLTHLTLEGYQNDAQTWEKFNLPELLHLDLTGCNIADNVVEGIAKSTKLTSLNLSGTQLTDKTIEVLAKNWTNLTSLNLRRLDITEKSIEAICQNCPNLQSLNLVLCHKVPATVCKLIQEALPNLKELRVPYQWIQAEMLNQLKAAKPELAVLEKTELIDANDSNVWYPAVILEETTRSYFVHLYGNDSQPWILKSDNKALAPIFTNKEKYGKQWPEHFSSKEKCKYCEILHPLCEHFQFGTSRNLAFINDWFFDSHEGKVFVNQLATQVKATGKLDLSMTLPAGLSFEKTAITALDSIPAELIKHVSIPKPVSTETFEHLLSGKPNLLSLSLLGPFTDEHASVVADKCSDSLTTLSLIGCSITDAGLSAIANQNQMLEFLTIKNCKQITDKGVEIILLASKSLDSVDLDFQYQPLTSASVKILTKIPTLAVATLSWGYKQKEIDDEVSFLKKKKPNTNVTRGLVLYDCMDTSNSWYPCVVKEYNEEEKKVFVHYYGWGENYDAWLELDGSDKLTDAWMHTEDYGSLYSSHFKDGCKLCSQLHQYCKGHTFSGNKLSFYLGN